MRFLLVSALATLVLALLAACAGAGAPEATASPSPAAARRSPTPAPSPTTVPKPDLQTLLEPGYILDQALDANFDGSAVGQIVVISHTVYGVASTGDPTAAAVPAAGDCPTDPEAEFQPTACIFRAEVFTYDPASGWTRVFVTPTPRGPLQPTEKGATYGHRGGIQELAEAIKFRVDSEREALVLGFHYCTGVGSGCGLLHEVLTMVGGEVKLVGGGWQAQVTIEATTVMISNPAYFGDDPFCCPSARRAETIALDPTTGELGVIAAELVACKEGELVGLPEPPRNTVQLRGCGSFEVTDQTVVEPASVGGIPGLRVGETVRIEYGVGECPDDGIPYNCSWGEVLLATRITVLP